MRRITIPTLLATLAFALPALSVTAQEVAHPAHIHEGVCPCLLYTSDAADE